MINGMECYTWYTITEGNIKQDLRYAQKSIYFAIFTHNTWSYLLWSPETYILIYIYIYRVRVENLICLFSGVIYFAENLTVDIDSGRSVFWGISIHVGAICFAQIV